MGRGRVSLLAAVDTYQSAPLRSIGRPYRHEGEHARDPAEEEPAVFPPLLLFDQLRLLLLDPEADEVLLLTEGLGLPDLDVALDACLGFGRTVASEIEVPTVLASLIQSG